MLSASLDDTGGGAAGSIYLKLIVTNKSAATCLLDGYPGVSLVKAGTDTPIGAPADRDAKAPSSGPIALAPGAMPPPSCSIRRPGNTRTAGRCRPTRSWSIRPARRTGW